MRYYLLIIGIVAVVTCVLGYVILRLTHRFKLYPTKIRDRDVHTRPTPRLGGVAMFLGILVGFFVASRLSFPNFELVFDADDQALNKVIGVLVAAFLIVLMGVADDIWDLDWWTKLAGQIIAGGILAFSGLQVHQLPFAGAGIVILPSNISLVITVLAVVLVMNAINFIDGLDGLVAGVALIANGVFFIYSYSLAVFLGNSDFLGLAALVTAVLIGACVGFLPLNFYPAKMFMGDAGALLVGLLMATSALSVTGQVDLANSESSYGGLIVPAFIPILLPIAILVLPLLDFGLAVLRRLRAGKSPFAADRLHLHHRLLDIGHSHLQAVLIFYGWTAVIAIGCLGYLFVSWPWATLFIVVGVVVCGFATVVPLLRRHPIDPNASAQVTPATITPLVIEPLVIDPASDIAARREATRIAAEKGHAS